MTPTPTRGSNDVPLSAKIIRSVMFGALRYVFLVPIPFVMTPLILHRLGVNGYGTWAVFLAINSMTSLADLGLVGTLRQICRRVLCASRFRLHSTGC